MDNSIPSIITTNIKGVKQVSLAIMHWSIRTILLICIFRITVASICKLCKSEGSLQILEATKVPCGKPVICLDCHQTRGKCGREVQAEELRCVAGDCEHIEIQIAECLADHTLVSCMNCVAQDEDSS